MRIVWHELLFKKVLDDRVSAIFDPNVFGIIHLRFAKTFRCGCLCQRSKHIKLSNRASCFSHPDRFIRDFIPHFTKQLILKLCRLFICAENFGFHLFQLRGDESLSICSSLLAGIGIGDEMQIWFGNLQIISKDRVITHLEVFDTSLLPFLNLQIRDPRFAIRGRASQGIDVRVILLRDNPSLAKRRRRIGHYCVFDQLHQRIHYFNSRT